MRYTQKLGAIALSTCLSLFACGPQEQPTSAPTPEVKTPTIEVPESTLKPAERTYFAVYMVGGDLEDDSAPRNGKADEAELGKESPNGSGSADLREMIQGYTALSTSEKERLNILVAFGGARKKGWQGVKYADMACLVKDSQDNYFGNDSCYLKQDAKANMASGKVLQDFLSFVQTQSENHAKTILDMWNHGVDYLGTGVDTTNNNDLIQLKEFKTAMDASKIKVDLMGFDACLMGSLEVAQVMQNHARYMVASEELEPGHGWNYTSILTYLGQKPEASVESIGRFLVDSYIDDPAHQKRRNKTLSLVDLEQLSPVVQALDQVVDKLDLGNFQSLLKALDDSQRYGVQSKDRVVFSIDLLHFAQNLVKQKQLSEAAALESALKQAVLYSRHDTAKPNSNGISVYSLNQKLKPAYGQEETFSPVWLQFANDFVRLGSNDTQSPIIKPVSSFSTAGFSIKQVEDTLLDEEEGDFQEVDFAADCTVDGEEGHCFEVSDNLGVERVSIVYGLELSDGRIVELGDDELDSLDEDYTQFFSPEWDRYWFKICSGPCDETDERVFAPAYFENETEEGHYIYTAEIDFNDETAMMYIEVDDEWNVIHEWVVPYELDDEGYPIHSRLQFDIEEDDEVIFYFSVYDPETDEETWEPLKEIYFDDLPEWEFVGLADELFYYFEAEDYNGNVTVSYLYELPPIGDEDEEDIEE